MTSQSAPRGLVGAPVYKVLVVDVLVSVVVKALILPGRVVVVTTLGTVVRVVVVFVFVVIVVLSMKHSFKQFIVASLLYLSASMHAFASLSSGQSWHLHTRSVMYSTNPSRPWQQSTLLEVSVRVVVVRVLVVVLRPRRVVNVVVVLVAVFVVPVAVVLAAVLGGGDGGDGGVSGGRGPGGGGVGAGPPPGAAGADLVLGKFQFPPPVE